MSQSKELMKATFGRHCETGVYTLKLYLRDHLVRYLKRFENCEALAASPIAI